MFPFSFSLTHQHAYLVQLIASYIIYEALITRRFSLRITYQSVTNYEGITGSLLPPERPHEAPSSNKQFKSRAAAGFKTLSKIYWRSQLKFLQSKDPVREKIEIARHMENKVSEMHYR